MNRAALGLPIRTSPRGHFPRTFRPPPGVGHFPSHICKNYHVCNVTDENVQALFVQVTAENLSDYMILSFINPSVSPHLLLYDTTPVKDFKSGAFF